MGSKRSSHVFLPSTISVQTSMPRLNSFSITSRVENVTLNVEFCWGYAGVMIGIRWYRSDGFIWISRSYVSEENKERVIVNYKGLTLGSQTGSPRLRTSSSMFLSSTGLGHSLREEKQEKMLNHYWPSLKNEEELVYNSGCSCIGIKLTGPSNQHGPRHTTKVAYRIRIDSTP